MKDFIIKGAQPSGSASFQRLAQSTPRSMDSARGQGRRPRNTPSSHGRNPNRRTPDRRNRYKDADRDNAAPLINSTSSSRSVQDTAPETSSSPSNSRQPKTHHQFHALRRKTLRKTTLNPVGPLSELKD